MKSVSLLVVDDEEVILKLFERLARREKWSFASCKNGVEAIDFLTRHDVACVVLDIHLPAYSGFQVLEHLKASRSNAEVVLITGSGSVENAVKALKMGAFDYLSKPFEDLEKVSSTLKNAMEKHHLVRKVAELQQPAPAMDSFQSLIGSSRAMQEIYQLVLSLKSSESPVLILGESGTGKELIAKAIHQTSKRSKRHFLVVNCAAIPEGLLESELFGHMKGSFTGAVYDKPGLFEEAHEGTLFLDEIGEISPAFQVKLLRVLQNGEFKRVGSGEIRYADVRLIAATNRDLKAMVQEGKFREDLYYRLNVIGMRVPPLRERKEDIPLLVRHFLEKYGEKMKKGLKEISLEAMQALQSYPWVGNVRELENVIERCMVLAGGPTIRAKDLPPSLLSQNFYPQDEEAELSKFNYRQAKLRALHLFNKTYISRLLKETRGNISLASDRAGMDRSNFKKILKKYEINVREFRKD